MSRIKFHQSFGVRRTMLSNKFSRTVKKSWRLYYNSIPLRNKIYIIVGIIVFLYIIASHRDISSEKKLRRKAFSVHGKHVSLFTI